MPEQQPPSDHFTVDDGQFKAHDQGQCLVEVPCLEAVAVRVSHAWVDPESFLAHARHVSEVVGRLEARLSCSERELVASRAREAVLRADMLASQEASLHAYNQQMVSPFMTRTKADADALTSKVDALAFRLDAQLGDLTAKHAETRKAALALGVRCSTLESRADAAAVQGLDFAKKCAQLRDSIAQEVADLQAQVTATAGLMAEQAAGLVALRGLCTVEAEKVGAIEAQLLNMREEHAGHARAETELGERLAAVVEAAQTHEAKTQVDIEGVRQQHEGRFEKLERVKVAREKTDTEAIENLRTDVLRLFRLARDHHRHDTFDDPVSVHGRVLDVLGAKVNSHAFLLTNLLGRPPPTGPVPPPGKESSSLPDGQYEDDFSDEGAQPRQRTDFAHRMKSDSDAGAASTTPRRTSVFYKPPASGSPNRKESRRVAPTWEKSSRSPSPSSSRAGGFPLDRSGAVSWRG